MTGAQAVSVDAVHYRVMRRAALWLMMLVLAACDTKRTLVLTNGVNDDINSAPAADVTTRTTTADGGDGGVEFDPYSLHADRVFQVRRGAADASGRHDADDDGGVNVDKVLTHALFFFSCFLV